MSKKFKIILAVLAAVLLVTIGVASAAMAQDEPTSPPGAMSFLARVAKILGIPEEQLTNAFKQAWKEMREERLEKKQQLMERWHERWQDIHCPYNWTANETSVTVPNGIIPDGTAY